MLIATTEGVAGRRTVATLGLVLGLAVRSRGLADNIMAGFHALGNGDALGEFGDELAAARREAVPQMAARTLHLGANAVVGVRFDAAEVGHDMGEIVAYSTAVVAEQVPWRPRKFRSPPPTNTAIPPARRVWVCASRISGRGGGRDEQGQ